MSQEKSYWGGIKRIFSRSLREKKAGTDHQLPAPPTPEWKARTLADFSAWLADLPDTPPPGEQASPASCDLYTLLSEFSALRQEIKMQNREQNRTVRHLSETGEAFMRSMALFEKTISGIGDLAGNIRREAEKNTVFPFLDVRDALVRGYRAGKAAMVPKRWYRPEIKGLTGIVEGYEMAIRRFDRALARSGISPVPAEGHPFDPKTMKAVARQENQDVEAGIVLEEHAGGFIRGDEVIRPAEVTVNSA